MHRVARRRKVDMLAHLKIRQIDYKLEKKQYNLKMEENAVEELSN